MPCALPASGGLLAPSGGLWLVGASPWSLALVSGLIFTPSSRSACVFLYSPSY